MRPTPDHPPSPPPPRRTRAARLRALCAAVCTAAGANAAGAQQVLVILGGDSEPYRAAAQACVDALDGEGVEAATIALDELDRAPAADADDLYLAIGLRAAESLTRQLPAEAPLVYCMLSEPEASSLAPRERSTGVTTTVPVADQFELIAEALPGAKRIGVLHRAGSHTSAALLRAARDRLPRGWSIEAVDLDAFQSPADGVRELIAARVDAVWTLPDPAVYDGALVKTLLIEALRSGTPVFAFSGQLVKAGTLAGVGISPAQQGRQAAGLARQFLAKPRATPPPLEPTYEIAVNLIVAEKLKIDLPQALIARADQVYK
ncbi:MAG TPA: ABC transporter substrate binding protein [Phycisphaerales bacterium]|nr:ABC transporter substrate binding protein [Phycisphaerales bacterium]